VISFLAISDVHVDARLFGVSRFPEIEIAMNLAVSTAIREKVDVFFFLGDLCDPDSGSCVFRAMRLALDCARKLSGHGIRSIWLAGNHDVIEDGSGETTLEPLKSCGAWTLSEKHARLPEKHSRVEVYDRPEWTGLGEVGMQEAVPCLVLPYTATSAHYDPEAFATKTWDLATAYCKTVVVLEHMDVEGALLGDETRDMARGRRLVYPRQVIEGLAAQRNQQLIQLGGHLHMRQRVGGLQIVGAPARFAFGERMNQPGFLLQEINASDQTVF
jgi:DNA repair exonuclease SbcCD nuclease subunit